MANHCFLFTKSHADVQDPDIFFVLQIKSISHAEVLIMVSRLMFTLGETPNSHLTTIKLRELRDLIVETPEREAGRYESKRLILSALHRQQIIRTDRQRLPLLEIFDASNDNRI